MVDDDKLKERAERFNLNEIDLNNHKKDYKSRRNNKFRRIRNRRKNFD